MCVLSICVLTNYNMITGLCLIWLQGRVFIHYSMITNTELRIMRLHISSHGPFAALSWLHDCRIFLADQRNCFQLIILPSNNLNPFKSDSDRSSRPWFRVWNIFKIRNLAGYNFPSLKKRPLPLLSSWVKCTWWQCQPISIRSWPWFRV